MSNLLIFRSKVVYAAHFLSPHDRGGLRSMLISPGKHRIKVGLPGYRTWS